MTIIITVYDHRRCYQKFIWFVVLFHGKPHSGSKFRVAREWKRFAFNGR
jgi:hypothetical protein